LHKKITHNKITLNVIKEDSEDNTDSRKIKIKPLEPRDSESASDIETENGSKKDKKTEQSYVYNEYTAVNNNAILTTNTQISMWVER
jgi:hypothetical protein